MSYPLPIEPDDKYPEDLGNNGEPIVEPQDEPKPDPDEWDDTDEKERAEDRYDSYVCNQYC